MIALVLLACAPDPALAGEKAAFTVVHTAFERPLGELERSTSEARPPLRGFFPRLGQGIDAEGAPRCDAWEPPRDELGQRAAQLVARRLAREGFVSTLARVIDLAGPSSFAADARTQWLCGVGLPMDWAACFVPPDGAVSLVAWLASRVSGHASENELFELAALPRFEFRASVPDLEIASESGEHAIASLRVHVVGARYWAGEHDGGALDVFRQLAQDPREFPIRAAIEARHVEPLLELAGAWNVPHPERVRLLEQDLIVSQWAQDNGKSGFIGGASEVLTLVPRYVNRGEEASAWVSGDARALEAASADGLRCARSPLLFQGGNTLVVRDPRRGERVLLLGEAELGRNVALGLTREQASEAFRIEFGVQRVLVLPALSYHVDYELSCRAIEGELVCFVNDAESASRFILRAALEVLEGARQLDAPSAHALREALERKDWPAFVESFAPVLFAHSVGAGRFPESFARAFHRGDADSHVANLERVLFALDFIASRTPMVPQGDRYLASYLDALRRSTAEHAQLEALLRAQGWRVVAVPSFSAGERSVNYLNGVQARGLYLLPVWGGLFTELDAAARRVFERELGADVRVVPVLTSESQRRHGALHCSVGIVPAPR